VDIIVNPILDNSFIGGFKSLDFAPAVRVAYNLPPKWALAAEEYADYGPLRNFYSVSQQELFAVLDRYSKTLNIEAGVGLWSYKLFGQNNFEADPVTRSQLACQKLSD